MKKFLAALLMTFLLTTPAQALPVQEAVQTALANNPSLQRTQQEIRVAEEDLKAARGRKGVSVGASSGVNFNKTEGIEKSENASVGLRASLPLYSGKRLETEIKLAELAIDCAKLDFSQAEDDLIHSVITAYIDALEKLATSKINQETEKNFAEHEQSIALQFEAGAKARLELLRAQVETSSAFQTTELSKAAYEVALTNLATFMSTDSIATLTVEDFETVVELGDVENYLSEADDNRCNLKADAIRVEEGELRVISAKSGWLPEVDASIGTEVNAQSSRWHMTPGASAGISATWNIFDNGVTRAEVEAAKVEVDRLKLAMNADIDTAHEAVVTAYKNLQIALVRHATTQKVVTIAEEQRYIATERYNAGEGILLEVLDAELALSKAKKDNVSAHYDVMRYTFDLAHATGNTLKAFGTA